MYGWIPHEGVGATALAAAGLADPRFPMSVTAIDMLTAVDAADSDNIAPILLRRDLAPAIRRQAARAGAPIDLPCSPGYQYLADLEDHLHRPRPYDAHWLDDHEVSGNRMVGSARTGTIDRDVNALGRPRFPEGRRAIRPC